MTVRFLHALKTAELLIIIIGLMSRSDPKRLASTLERENEESCTTYNMLKVYILKCFRKGNMGIVLVV